MGFHELFGRNKPMIDCVHLLPLPGAPDYDGRMGPVYDTALSEVAVFKRQGVD